MILENDPIDTYHARLRDAPPTYSHTPLRYGAVHGMRALRMLQQGEIEIEDRPTFAWGRAFETRLCDGRDAYLQLVAIKPDGHDGRTTEGKAWLAASKGRLVMSVPDDRMIEDMVATLGEIPEVTSFLDRSTWAQQVTLAADFDGVLVQSRPDSVFMRDGQAITVDLKTCVDLSKLTSGRGIADFGYHTQAALARICARANGLDVTQSYILAVEKSYPSRAALIELSPMFVDLGEYEVSRWVDRVRECTESGVWPRSDATTFLAEPPAWLTRQP